MKRGFDIFTHVVVFSLTISLAYSTLAQQIDDAKLVSAINEIDQLTTAEFDKDNHRGLTLGIVSGTKLIWTNSYGTTDSERKIVAVPSQTPVTNEAEKLARIEELIVTEFEKDKIGDLSVGVITRSGKQWSKNYGVDADGSPASDKTVYRIGSITKQFTALMLLQLVSQGKVRLSDPVEKYLPEVNKIQNRYVNSPPITLVQLATHTAGLSAEPETPENFSIGPVKEWEKQMKAALSHTKFISEPGSRFSYSNIGYAILGAALSKAAGISYIDYVQKNILEPLGMKDTTFELTESTTLRLAVGYEIGSTGSSKTGSQREQTGRGYRVPNGGLYSTLDDLSKFIAFELGMGPETVLKREQVEENFSRLIASNASLSGGYGLGFETFRRGDLQGFGHSGSVIGYESAAYFTRNSKTAVILLRSATGGQFRGTRLCVNILQTINSP